MIEVWTDGACSGNPGAGGWGVLILSSKGEATLSGGCAATTNNRMELLAAIKGLEACQQEQAQGVGEIIALYTDSEYLKKGITTWSKKWQANGWRTAKRAAVKNADLWRQLLLLDGVLMVEWHWVKAHSGIPHNERADQLATDAIKNYTEGEAKT